MVVVMIKLKMSIEDLRLLKLSWKQCKFCGLSCRMIQVIECFNLKKKV